MNKEFDAFCNELRGLTNAEAITEIIKKRQAISRRQEMKTKPDVQAIEVDDLLRNLYEMVDNLNRGEMFSKETVIA